MVGLTIGLILLAGLSYMFLDSSRARAELDKSMQQLENGRYAMQLLKEELRLAGYYGPSYEFGATPVAAPDPCATDTASLKAAMPVAVQGYRQPSTNPISTCLADANFTTNNDILVIRRAQTVTTTVASANAAAIYLQANGESVVLDVGANTANFTLQSKGATTPIRPFVVRIYFVSPCDVPASGSNCTGNTDDSGVPIPTLKRLELTPSGWQVVPLVQGVERFAVEYGVDGNSDGAPDSYVGTVAGATDWGNVVTVRIHLLVRSTRPSADYEDTKTYRLGTPGSGTIVTVNAPNDGYKRHVFSETIRLTNVSGRREV